MRTRCGTGKCILTLGLAALLAGCGADPNPEPAPPMKPAAPAPVIPPPPAVVAAKPDTAPPLKPPPEPPKPPAFVPPPMKAATADPERFMVNFRLLTMDHLKAYVLVNGERVTDAPCLWGFSDSYEFDPRIPVPDWPPKGAAFVASEALRGSNGVPNSRVELALDGGLYDLASQDRIKKGFPHLAPGEMILYVNALILDKSRRGALRLKLVGEDGGVYRYTNFTPLQSVEDEMASRYRRAIWFQRERSE